MGNKSKLLEFIYSNVNKEKLDKENIIFDAFAGTTNVGRYFKDRGFDVVCNDINDLSYVLGLCYIENNQIPLFERLLHSSCYSCQNYKKVRHTDSFEFRRNKLIEENKNMLDASAVEMLRGTNYLDILVYLTYYATPADYDNDVDNGSRKEKLYEFLQRNYCENGSNSKYINLVYKKTLDKLIADLQDDRVTLLINKFYCEYNVENLVLAKEYIEKKYGRIEQFDKLALMLEKDNIVGTRKFFSLEHAKRLDIIINTICYWKNNDWMDNNEFYILLTAVIESIAIFSNTSATYQAFYKEYKANTLQAFRLIIPQLNIGSNNCKAIQGDIFDNINAEEYDILYLDPPYNWRQYDSNYHLLNTVAKINDMEDIGEFEAGIIGASGENRSNKLKYVSFNCKETFEERLFDLIRRSNCSLVVISYSDSESNHRIEDTKRTIDLIEEFLRDETVFVRDSYRKIEFERQNFESRKANKKQNINELLFIARRRR